MAKTFRTAFLQALDQSGESLSSVARGSGVSEGQLKKLKARENASTNVDDAVKVAAHFGMTLDQFLGDPELKDPVEIVQLYNQLPDHLKGKFAAYGEGLLEAVDLPSDEGLPSEAS